MKTLLDILREKRELEEMKHMVAKDETTKNENSCAETSYALYIIRDMIRYIDEFSADENIANFINKIKVDYQEEMISKGQKEYALLLLEDIENEYKKNKKNGVFNC